MQTNSLAENTQKELDYNDPYVQCYYEYHHNVVELRIGDDYKSTIIYDYNEIDELQYDLYNKYWSDFARGNTRVIIVYAEFDKNIDTKIELDNHCISYESLWIGDIY